LWGFFCFVLCGFVLFWFFQSVYPLMRQPQNYFWSTISRTGGWGMNTKIIKTETLLHWTWRFFLIYIFFIYLYLYLFIYLFLIFLYFLFSILCLSNAFSSYSWLVHCLSLFISLKLFCLFLCFIFSTCLFVFPFSFNFFAFHLLSLFHYKYH
jgi:hypothetical protein